MTEISTLAPDFVEAAHAIVYCSVATVDRPIPGVMHHAWEWDGQQLTGWLTTSRAPSGHLADWPRTTTAGRSRSWPTAGSSP